MVESLIANVHSLLTTHPELNLLWVFLAGILSSLTPCVYPLIPVTLAIFGALGEESKKKRFLLSLTYVLGIAVTYTGLGLFSAKTGTLFGSLLGNPIFVVVIAIVLLVLTLFTLEMIKLDFAYALQTKASSVGGKGFGGAFLMGAMSGFVAAPCVGPILVVILGIAAASKNTLWGGLLLFSYAMGLGVLFIVLGTFSGLLKKIPKSGNWLKVVKLIIAVALLAVTFFLLNSILSSYFDVLASALRGAPLLAFWLVALAIAVFGLKKEIKSITFAGSLMIAAAIYFGFIAIPAPANVAGVDGESAHSSWLTNLDEAVAKAKAEHKPAMVDLFADWCAACKELEKFTFPDAGVRETLKSFVAARVDFTTDNETTDAISEKYGVVGLPCILFFDAEGNELKDLRITGFVPPEEFRKHLEKIKARS